MRRFTWLMLALLAAAMLAVGPAAADDDDGDDDGGGTRTWQVTITNLTPAGPGAPGSQPISPPLFAVHSSKADVWSVGDIASHGVAAIAEDANNAVLESALPQLSGFKTVFTGAGGPIPSGASRSFTVQTQGRFNRLSIVTMLVNTNDAFTGLDSLRLRGNGETRSTAAYDAGSEVNNERASHIPGPCCNNMFVRAPEGQLIRSHAGITGVGDLSPALYDWTDPVARIAIERVS
jgi:Spondin_N